MEAEMHQKSVNERFKEWIEDNAASVPFTMGNVTGREWVTLITQNAKTTIPIEFLSSRLNVYGNFYELTVTGSLRQVFDHLANTFGLAWCVTEDGLWMAKDFPASTTYINAMGKICQPTQTAQQAWTSERVENEKKLSEDEFETRRDALLESTRKSRRKTITKKQAAMVFRTKERTIGNWVDEGRLDSAGRGKVSISSVKLEYKIVFGEEL